MGVFVNIKEGKEALVEAAVEDIPEKDMNALKGKIALVIARDLFNDPKFTPSDIEKQIIDAYYKIPLSVKRSADESSALMKVYGYYKSNGANPWDFPKIGEMVPAGPITMIAGMIAKKLDLPEIVEFTGK